MRAILIAVFLFLAALGVTYGNKYQTGLIEAEVEARVAERLETLNAQGIKTHVDKRKVVLSGIVASEADRAKLLAATQLLPSVDTVIDGLSVISGKSHFTAVKLPDGLIISGDVQDQTMRDALLAQAASVSEGEVLDNLEVTGRPVSWLSDARLGLEKLAPLKSGVLSLSNDSSALSGISADDPSDLVSDLIKLKGWRISVDTDRDITALEADRIALKDALFIAETELEALRQEKSSTFEPIPQIPAAPEPALAQDVTERIAKLEAELEQRQKAITSLRGQIQDRDTALYDAQSKADAAQAELASLRETSPAPDPSASAPDGTRPENTSCASMSEALLGSGQISFDTGTASLSPSSIALLERLTGVAMLCVSPTLKLEVGGHTDSQGREAYNLQLSQERANTVRAFLTERGVSPEGVTSAGYGETQPIADNDTPEGRAANRRISFRWSTL